MVLIKKAHNYILRAKVIELKVKEEPVADNKVNKANEVDLLLNSLLINSINNIKIIIKKKPLNYNAIEKKVYLLNKTSG
jgi:hypothetical protein